MIYQIEQIHPLSLLKDSSKELSIAPIVNWVCFIHVLQWLLLECREMFIYLSLLSVSLTDFICSTTFEFSALQFLGKESLCLCDVSFVSFFLSRQCLLTYNVG
jgi:hypothetical protein